MMLDDDNRVAANALVHEGLREISPFVVKRLRKMMRSREALRVSSALYALGEVAVHHKKRDSVYFSTRTDFQNLLQEIPRYVFHEDERVRRQALVAARKIADQQIAKAIWVLAKEPRHANRLSEVNELLERQTLREDKKAA